MPEHDIEGQTTTEEQPPIGNREEWLTEFAKKALPYIERQTGLDQGDKIIQLSCGFPSSGGKVRKSGTFTSGECHHIHGTNRKRFQLFIHPARVNAVDEVGETIIHELLHALLPGGVGHRKPFSQAMKKVGLEGKPTQTHLGDELREVVKRWVAELGPYPHEGLTAYGKVQTTRLLKTMCPVCGYTARVTLKWLDEAGPPLCPQCGVPFEEADAGDVASSPLTAVEQNVEYKVKAIKRRLSDRQTYDPRWSVFMTRKGQVIHWWVLDYGLPVSMDGTPFGPEPTEPGKGIAVLGPVSPMRTIAESREDALSLLEALRDGSMTYDDIPEQDHDEPDDWEAEPDEPGDWPEDEPYLGDEDIETPDNPEADDDPRFGWEIKRGISIESLDPEDERRKREGWVADTDTNKE